MALDGICIHAIVNELNNTILGGKINKIAQPEKEELLITIKSENGAFKLLLSANASLPFLYLTDSNMVSPANAPAFCMMLRKHIGVGRIINICQIGFERVIRFDIQHLNELGDVAIKHLYIEIMGKHSNIIFCDEKDMILDSIKHVSAQMSSVREVLPGRDYFIPTQEGKLDPTAVTEDYFKNTLLKKPSVVGKSIYSSLIGISPVIANEICYRAGIDADTVNASLFDEHKDKLWLQYEELMNTVNNNTFTPSIYFDPTTDEPVEYSPIVLTMYADFKGLEVDSISTVLSTYFAQKNEFTIIRQKSVDLRKIITNHIERASKKLDLQQKQLLDTDKKDKYRIYGEMLHTYGYQVTEPVKSLRVLNYYTNEEMDIPLDPTLTASENAKKYFDKYTKLKRTAEALDTYIEASQHELELLKTIEVSLDIARSESDLNEIRAELIEYGFIKKSFTKGKQPKLTLSKPLHFVDDNGFHIYVGKNNRQNDLLTFKMATGNDWWFHTKKAPGSHVIVKCEGKELPDSTYEYAAQLAAYFSSMKDSNRVEIDYLQKKNVKKPAGAAAGFVVYYTNFSMVATPSLKHVTEIID